MSPRFAVSAPSGLWRTTVPVIVAMVAVVALVVGIAAASGFSAVRVHTTDGAVWVTSADRQAIGRANIRIQQLGSVVETSSDLVDVVQSESNVYLVDDSRHTLAAIDERTNTPTSPVTLPVGVTDVHLSDNALIAHASETGDVWVVPLDSVSTFDARSPARFTVGPQSRIAVDNVGHLAAVSTKDATVTTVNVATAAEPVTTALNTTLSADQVSVTVVGAAWAVLDAASGTLFLPGHQVSLAESSVGIPGQGVLALPSATATEAVVAYSGGVASISLAGAVSSIYSATSLGRPVAPALSDGCIYGAWSLGRVWVHCLTMPDVTVDLDELSASSRLTIRERAGVLALNDTASGLSWTLQDGVHVIDNWDDLLRKDDAQQTVVNDDSGTETVDPTPQPPVARDDEFGARAGLLTTLPVLLNDYDPNGDILVVTYVTPVTGGDGSVAVGPDRTSVRLDLGAGASGQISFSYTVDDGRGGASTARVLVTVRSEAENSPPTQVRVTTAEVTSGGQTTFSALGDWVDPDGDAIHVTAASADGAGTVTFTPAGRMSYSDAGTASGVVRLSLDVSDGRATGSGVVLVRITPEAERSIRADSFAVLTYPDTPVTVAPADRVRGGSGALSLIGVPAVTGLDIVPNFDGFTFSVASGRAGTFYVRYAVSDGRANGSGLVRVDVIPRPSQDSAPVTAPHQIVVGVQQTRSVDVTATDVDPAGGVLVVTGITSGGSSPEMRAEVVDNHIVRVTLLRPLDGPRIIRYRVSNGVTEAEGQVTVVEATPPAVALPPIAVADAATVRANNVVDIPVLANDVHPQGGALTLGSTLDSPLPEGSGLLFVSGHRLRYLAPDTAGTYSAAYRVIADNGQWATGSITLTVRPNDASSNRAPQPVAVDARVVAGASVRIPIPLTGIDPDGDSVQLAGLASNPEKGAVIQVGSSWIDYEAGPYAALTDTFTYTVIDGLGAQATGRIRVGIAGETTGSTNPTANPDNVVVRPGRTITVDPLANDSDPGQRPLTITRVAPTDSRVVATIVGDLVSVTVPEASGTFAVAYDIANEAAGTASTFITLTVRDDAPLNAPVVPDTVVALSDILNRAEIDVNPLAQAFWADGAVSALSPAIVTGYPVTARFTATDNLRVSIGQKSQIIPIRVAHPDDAEVVTYAFIWVPGTDDARPQLKRGLKPIEVVSEKTVRVSINDYVTAAVGRSVRLTSSDTVRATHANGDNLVIDDQTIEFTSARTYFGPASLSFEVTDGSSASDPEGRRSVIVLPLTVLPRENQPPVLQDTNIDAEPSSTRVIDLVKITKYPYAKNLDELTYRVQGGADGVTAVLSGTELTVSVDAGAPKGATIPIEVTPSDALHEGTTGTVLVRVVPSTRPLVVPQADRVDIRRGQAVSVDVLANDQATNPFPETPLKVLTVRGSDATDLPPGVTVVPSPDKSTLNVVIAPSASPRDVTLQYQVADATNDPDRYTWGVVTLSIQDVPDAPSKPVRASGFVSGELTLSWAAPAANNSPILRYVVSSTAGYQRDCNSTVCTLTGLPGGSRFQFSVVAVNELGASEPSPVSDPLGADQVPPPPSAVTIAGVPFDATHPDGGGVDVRWSAVTAPPGASSVAGYRVQLVEDGRVVLDTLEASTATSLPRYWGFAGASYIARVAAVNDADTTDWNWQSSAAVTAAGPPRWTTGPSVDATGQRVSWGALDRKGSADAPVYFVWRSMSEPTSACPADPASGALTSTETLSWDDPAPLADGTYWYAVYGRTSYGCAGGVTSVTVANAPGTASYGAALLTAVDGVTTRIAVTDPTVDRAPAAVATWQVLVGGSWIDLVPNISTTGTFEVDVTTALLSNPFIVTIRGCTIDSVCGSPGGDTSLPVPAFGG